jgi:putative heme-binding domain-containing protein
VATLSSRPAAAKLLLSLIARGAVRRDAVPAFQIRQMAGFPDEQIRGQVAKLWPELQQVSGAKRQRMDALKSQLTETTLHSADRGNGRRHFVKACATCHVLFGQGGKIGPDLTGSQRTNLDYLLENIVDPSATMAPAYRMSTVALADGRVVNGIVGDRSTPTIAIQTPTERLVVSRSDVEQIRDTGLSLMPEGLVDTMSAKDLRDLIAYLMSPQQVPLPSEPLATTPAGGN